MVAQGRSACVAADAACPRGTRRAGAVCARPPRCPPGTLGTLAVVGGDACQPVVTVGVSDDLPRVDLGAWAVLVFGADGGRGSADLCRPLSLRPETFGVPRGESARVSVRIAIVAPDEDLTRVHARIRGMLWTQASSRPLSAEAEAIVVDSVLTLMEPLRGLGGEASTAVVELEVSCGVSSL
jgi:hypothetical protein